MKHNKEIGDFFKDKFDDFEKKPSKNVWNNIDDNTNTKTIFLSPTKILFMSITATLLIGIVILITPKTNKIIDAEKFENRIKETQHNLAKTTKNNVVSYSKENETKNKQNFSSSIMKLNNETKIIKQTKINPLKNSTIIAKKVNNVSQIKTPNINLKEETTIKPNYEKEKAQLKNSTKLNETIIDSAKTATSKINIQIDSSITLNDSNLVLLQPDSIIIKTADTVQEAKTFFNKNIKSRPYVNFNIAHNYAFDNSTKFEIDMGAIFEDKIHLGFSSSFSVKENYINNNIDSGKIDLSSALLGIELGFNLSPKKKISIIPYLNYRIGYLQYNESNSKNYINIYEETFQNTELGIRTYLNLTKSIRLGGTISYGLSNKINKIPNANNATYSGINIGGSLQFHMSNWVKKTIKSKKGIEYEQLTPSSNK